MAETVETKKRPVLSGWPMLFGWIAMIIFALHASTHMVAAGDTWVAMACGRHFINHGVDTVEPFSANSHKAGPTEEEIQKWPGWAQWITQKVGLKTVKYWHPTGWVNQNWLTHVIFYWLTHKSPIADAESRSFNTLVYWKFALYIITVIIVYYTGRVLGVNPALSAVFSCFAMFVGRSFLDIRPAGFSNMLVAVFLFILVLATHRNILYIWLLVPIVVFWCNVHGGYIYVFIMLTGFVALNFLTIISKKWFVSIGIKGIYHTIAAGAVTFIAMVIFNPFHLTNLTHTFLISVSKHAEMWRTVNEWKPAFDWANPVGTAVPFLIMYIIAWVVFVLWVVVLFVTSRVVRRRQKSKVKTTEQYQWPRVDLALITIAALTIYMALRSRRFIPIAAIAACPVLALFIQQIVCTISAAYNLNKSNRLVLGSVPKLLQRLFISIGIFATAFFGIWWGLKFKLVYLDPWPSDSKLNSVFMRMTASDAKPFYALQFIRENKMEGKMFNYWTEGGFIAYGQQPDPNTGKTPLQLFMDGRAQAAYEPKIYKLWSTIMAGGPEVTSAAVRKQKLNNAIYEKIGQWISQQLRNHNVWAVLMPSNQFDKPLVEGLERNSQWPLVFLSDRQKLFVDIRTDQGRKLFEGIFSGKTVYPDESLKSLILAHYMLSNEKTAKAGLDHAIKSLQLTPSRLAIRRILFAAKYPDLGASVYEFCKKYFDDFVENKDIYIKQDGYHNSAAAALWASGHLQTIAQRQNNKDLVESYVKKRQEYSREANDMLRKKRW